MGSFAQRRVQKRDLTCNRIPLTRDSSNAEGGHGGAGPEEGRRVTRKCRNPGGSGLEGG